jgi:MSHA biogenesis protein MshQ
VLTITAVNLLGATTQNYDCGGFWKLADPYTLAYIYSDGAGAGPTLSPAGGSVSPAAGDTTDCNGSVSLTLSDNFTYSRPALAAPVQPFAASLSLTAAAAQFTDGDGVCFDAGSGCQGFSRPGITGAALRHGQATASNGYAPETVTMADPLLLPSSVLYYDSSGSWLLNGSDSCSQAAYAITPNGTITVGGNPPSPLTFAAGRVDLQLWPTADPAPAGGSVDITYDFPSWLEPDLQVEAFFGIFRGNDRIINWREINR